MESYIEKIKKNAETLIKDAFPAKALELDGIINVFFLLTFQNASFYLSIRILIFQTPKFDTNKISKILDTNELPKTEDFLHTISGIENSDLNQNEHQKENIDDTNQVQAQVLLLT